MSPARRLMIFLFIRIMRRSTGTTEVSAERTALVGRAAKERLVENRIASMRCSSGQRKDNLQDLAQDIYFELLTGDRVPDDYEQLRYFTARVILNNINSTTSRYYAKYRKTELERTDANISAELGYFDTGGSDDADGEDGCLQGFDGD